MSKITEQVWKMAEDPVKNAGCEIWDVEYVKEAGGWFLRIYIDKAGGVSIDDCEAVSRAVDPLLDEYDPIPDNYVFEVSSAGAERQLKRPSDFEKFIGSTVEVKLYKNLDGRKEYIGTLAGYEDGNVSMNVGGAVKTFSKNDVANVRLRIV